jgi:parvulin-like peptidyl-prolyl isomerase
MVALIVFSVGLSSMLGFRFSVPLPSNVAPQATDTPMPTVPSPIFRIDNTLVTDVQWHQAVQSAFSSLVSSSQFPGGSSTDSQIINAQAMHSIVDPLATREIAEILGLSTNVGDLYKQWLAQASSQERQTVQANQNDPGYQQQKAQAQLEKEIVARFVNLPVPTASDVYTYYQQHIADFARSAPQVHVQQIVVNSQQAAQQVIAQLQQGVPFATVEATYDVSSAYYTAHGGDLGWVTLGGWGFPPEWTAHVSELQAGQVGAPFLVDGKYYIVKCIERSASDPRPFSQVQGQVHDALVSTQIHVAFVHILAQHESSMHIMLLDQRYSAVLQDFTEALRTA